MFAAPSEAPSQVDVFSYSSSAVRVRWSPIKQKSGDSNFEGYKVNTLASWFLVSYNWNSEIDAESETREKC